METTPAPDTLAPVDVRAQLHQVIDQIADQAVLQAALLLLLPQAPAAEAAEPELSPAWLAELDRRLAEGTRQLDAGQGIPFAEALARLQQVPAA